MRVVAKIRALREYFGIAITDEFAVGYMDRDGVLDYSKLTALSFNELVESGELKPAKKNGRTIEVDGRPMFKKEDVDKVLNEMIFLDHFSNIPDGEKQAEMDHLLGK